MIDKEASKEVEEETIKLAEEIVNVDLGVSRDFAKSALEGKEIIFVIGKFLALSDKFPNPTHY